LFVKIAPKNPVFVDGDEGCVCCKQKKTDRMTTGFGFRVFVIPNLVQDLALVLKSPPFGWVFYKKLPPLKPGWQLPIDIALKRIKLT